VRASRGEAAHRAAARDSIAGNLPFFFVGFFFFFFVSRRICCKGNLRQCSACSELEQESAALLAQTYLLYWLERTNTDAANLLQGKLAASLSKSLNLTLQPGTFVPVTHVLLCQ
jgi:hypothetical protein